MRENVPNGNHLLFIRNRCDKTYISTNVEDCQGCSFACLTKFSYSYWYRVRLRKCFAQICKGLKSPCFYQLIPPLKHTSGSRMSMRKFVQFFSSSDMHWVLQRVSAPYTVTSSGYYTIHKLSYQKITMEKTLRLPTNIQRRQPLNNTHRL